MHEPADTANRGKRMTIEGMLLVIDERAPDDQCLCVSPGHEWNSTGEIALVCNKKTFRDLLTSEPFMRQVQTMVKIIRGAQVRGLAMRN